MTNTTLSTDSRPVIHRAGLNAYPLCGAPAGHISYYGVGVTCPACIEASTPPSREARIAALHEAAAKVRADREAKQARRSVGGIA